MIPALDRLRGRLCYFWVMAIPFRWPRWLYWWALPHAGSHAHYWSQSPEDRAAHDADVQKAGQ